MAQISSSRIAACLALLVLALFTSQVLADPSEQNNSTVFLHAGWTLQSSCQVKASGERISSLGFRTDGWHATTVPSTVVASLVADKTYPDPNFAMNLRSIPGTSYPIGANFSLLPMPPDSPFRCSWWYRTEFRIPENFASRHVWLHFNGINYRANVWVNGVMIASAKSVAGAYRTYEFNISPLVRRDRENVLAVETFAPTEKDLAMTFADWNPAPPDKLMGLWGDVYLQASGIVSIRDPQVVTHFPDSSLARGDLTVMAMLRNATSKQVTGTLEGNIGELKFRQMVTLKPEETRAVQFTPEKFPDLRVHNPTLWWPYPLGPQNLHELTLRFVVGGELSDVQTIRFGIREITSELSQKGYRLFRVNGKRILIRGAGWAPDMLLRQSRERLEAQFQYIRDLNLNTVRLEGKLESDDFYDLADEYGVLIMAGWSCCDAWEQWSEWKPGDLTIATKSLHSQILRMRSHPSMLVWLNGSDNPPPAKVEKAYLAILKEANWPNPILSSAQNKPTTVTGLSGVKMTGPYDYVPPAYWLKDPGQYGGAYGFNTETSSGAAIPLVSSLRRMIPPDHLWPIDDFWNYRAASHEFKNLNRFTKALDESYGHAASLEDYVTKSQAMAYDAERAMFEAYARNKYTSTGVIQWMLNNAWPSLFWHLYDYFLQPAGGYFGAKKACEPVHVQYSYDDRSVVVVNSLYEKFPNLDVAAELFDFNLKKRYSERVQIGLDADTIKRVLTIPPTESDASSPVYFLSLTLEDSTHRVVSSNFYWLTSKPANIEYSKTIYFGNPAPPVNTALESSIYTPASPYDDFTALKMLPRVSLHAAATIERGEHGSRVRVSLRNTADHLAFQIRLGIRKKDEEMEILPVLWDDNYVELMPGESREISARYLTPRALDGESELLIAGWNIEPVVIPLVEANHDK